MDVRVDVSRRAIRVLLLCGILLASIPTASAYYSDLTRTGTQGFEPDVEPPPVEGPVAISSQTGFLVVYGPEGEVVYREEEYDAYLDVDPVDRSGTIEFIATEIVEDGCPTEVVRGCHRNIVERINTSTGERTRLYSNLQVGGWVGWHDVDRIDDHRLVVAGIKHDRVFIVNTTSELIEWQWEAGTEYDPRSGGHYRGDWTHLNDVEVLPDGRLMASLRNHDQVVFLDRRTGLQESWTLGEDDDHSVLYEQHNPDYIPPSDGGPAVVVADSENNRILEYARRDGEWERTWHWQTPQLQWPRDADRLPDGQTLVTDSNGGRVLVVSRNASVVWNVSIARPYDSEVLATGPESGGGPSAEAAGLTSRGTLSTSEGATDSISTLDRLQLTVRKLLPSIVVNGILFVLPSWIGFLDLLTLLGAIALAGLWILLELYWRGYRLRVPVVRS